MSRSAKNFLKYLRFPTAVRTTPFFCQYNTGRYFFHLIVIPINFLSICIILFFQTLEEMSNLRTGIIIKLKHKYIYIFFAVNRGNRKKFKTSVSVQHHTLLPIPPKVFGIMHSYTIYFKLFVAPNYSPQGEFGYDDYDNIKYS